MASSTTDFRNFPTWESHPHFGHAPWNRLDGQANSPMHGTGAGLTSSGPYSRAASFGEEDGEEEQGVGIPTSKSKDNRRTKLMQNTDKTAHLMKRREQNRTSQRTSRQKRELHTKELEIKVEELADLLESAKVENIVAHSHIKRMESELSYYRQLLFASQTQNKAPGLTPGMPATSTAFSDLQFTPDFGTASGSHAMSPWSSPGPSLDAAGRRVARNDTSVMDNRFAATCADADSLSVDPYTAPQSLQTKPPIGLTSPVNTALAILNTRNSWSSTATPREEAWGFNVSGWEPDGYPSLRSPAPISLQ